ncbi:MAG: acyltransferase family protein [Alcanivoracaceae bacterium]|nr:acyltransferase family protein [Alcanivoracaceae bacterium]
MSNQTTGEDITEPKQTGESLDTATSTRFHYLDNVRALAMFAGIVFHAALAYSPLMHNLWFTTSSQTSAVLDMFSWFIHLFRMPVFFLISGFFTLMLIQKRGISGLLKNRALRILLPFIVFYPFIMWSYVALIGWGINNLENLSPMLQFFKMMKDVPDTPPPELSTTHLWFLFNLFLFVLTVALMYKLKFFQSKFVSKITSVKFIIIIFPLVLVPALVTQSVPHPAPEKFYPQLWSFGFYGLFFILGSMVFLKQNILNELNRYKKGLLAASIIIYAFFYYSLPDTISIETIMVMMAGNNYNLSYFIKQIPLAMAEAYIAVYMTLYCLLIGKQFLNKHNKAFKLISDSSYWVYIIHMPVLLMVQFLMTDIEINIWLQFVISISVTFIIGMSTYFAFIRWSPIGWLLNGRKKKTV